MRADAEGTAVGHQTVAIERGSATMMPISSAAGNMAQLERREAAVTGMPGVEIGMIEVIEKDESVATEDHERKDEVRGEERSRVLDEVVHQCQKSPRHGAKIIEREVVLAVGRTVRREEDEMMAERAAMQGSDFEGITMVHRMESLSGPDDLETRTEPEISSIPFYHDVFGTTQLFLCFIQAPSSVFYNVMETYKHIFVYPVVHGLTVPTLQEQLILRYLQALL